MAWRGSHPYGGQKGKGKGQRIVKIPRNEQEQLTHLSYFMANVLRHDQRISHHGFVPLHGTESLESLYIAKAQKESKEDLLL